MEALPCYEVEYRVVDRQWIVRRNGRKPRHLAAFDTVGRGNRCPSTRAATTCDVVVKGRDGSVERRYDQQHCTAQPR